MRYVVRHETQFRYSEPVPVARSQVRLAPRELPTQHCSRHRVVVKPGPTVRGRRIDYCGNAVDFFSIDEPHRALSVTAHSRVEVLETAPVREDDTPAWETMVETIRADLSPSGLDAYQFVFDSPRVAATDALAVLARRSFTPRRPILDAARELTSRIHEEFTYDPTATTVQTPLEDVLSNQRGVCQDFAHVQIGCLRALGLAARYVSGYLETDPPPGQPRMVGADASHAWVSVFCGRAGWVDLDPTTDLDVSTRHVTLAWGRDYNDVCPVQGVVVGGGDHRMTVSVDVRREA